MLIQPTLDTLNRLKLHGMALALSEQMTHNAAGARVRGTTCVAARTRSTPSRESTHDAPAAASATQIS